MEALVFILIYAIPSIIAFRRYHNSAVAILLTNLLLGWTGIGWVVALIWAFTGNTDKRTWKESHDEKQAKKELYKQQYEELYGKYYPKKGE